MNWLRFMGLGFSLRYGSGIVDLQPGRLFSCVDEGWEDSDYLGEGIWQDA